ncbi:inhibitor of apoptosis 3 [Diatraea saccharalis granulovirus]|uniref:Inhibitor of apoptosis 3 n=1 Tax=Diatraea saccharalis granulovirus TaxID=1675862 RepID=A0A0R7EYS0_9BBAC|nr:inhibitor of apoptosis 3 [Diatraea saccharalis granulovirus]AKN80731.1 inhibitor of apoptosis 3 [Diatraea saccharalis granulovirus]
MLLEAERLSTFQGWPVTFITPEVMARNGFYYLGRGDEVRCAFCKVEIMRWEEGDDPAEDHKRWAPQCPFVRNVTENTDVNENNTDVNVNIENRLVANINPAHPQYSSEAARLNTFKDWPRGLRQRPKELADAGFFYTGEGDKTKCYYCDGGLRDWNEEDIPWEEHARWFDRCVYVKLVKGEDFIQRVKSEACLITPTVPKEEEEEEEEEEIKDEERLCKICFKEERNVALIPCGHVVLCPKCSLSVKNCPVCRSDFVNVIKIFY